MPPQKGQCPKEDVISISYILWPCSFEGLYEHCADKIVSYSEEKFSAGGNEETFYEQIGESHPLFGPAFEILLNREDGTRAVEWTCETPDLRIGIILERQEWCNPVWGAKNSSASRWFASDNGAKLWLAVEAIPSCVKENDH